MATILQFKRRELPMNYATIDTVKLANFMIECAANELRKVNPSMTEQQAFTRAYCDPANARFAKAERQASRARIAGIPKARTEPEVLQTLSDSDIKRLVDEERRLNATLTDRELYARINASDAVRQHRSEFHAALAAARRDGRTLKTDEIEKRDVALDALRARADDLRKFDPNLTPEQAFAKVYRLEPALAARERSASRAALHAV